MSKDDKLIYKKEDFDQTFRGLSAVNQASKFAKRASKISARIESILDENELGNITKEKREQNQEELEKLWAELDAAGRVGDLSTPRTSGLAYLAYRGCAVVATMAVAVAIIAIVVALF